MTRTTFVFSGPNWLLVPSQQITRFFGMTFGARVVTRESDPSQSSTRSLGEQREAVGRHAVGRRRRLVGSHLQVLDDGVALVTRQLGADDATLILRFRRLVLV